MVKRKKEIVSQEPKDENQRRYREFFGITDKFLIHYSMDEANHGGYIVFIDFDNDLDYVIKGQREWSNEDKIIGDGSLT